MKSTFVSKFDRRVIDVAEKRRRRRLRALLVEEQGGLCHWCKVPMTEPRRDQPTLPALPTDASIDHHPIRWVDGGKTDRSNCVAACHDCNTRRGGEASKSD